MHHTNTPFDRRADLDALRAFAMLLGIVLHASLSFFTSFWIVADRQQSPAFGILFSAIHGFRMPVFFVMSGFFSAMLLHRRGRGALIKHRFHRVFLPLLLGMVTFVPATNWISTVAISSASLRPENTPRAEAAPKLGDAAGDGDLAAVEQLLEGGASVNGFDGELRVTPLHRAALANRAEVAERLIEHGADVNATATDGGTPLHAAAFLGNKEVVAILLEHGANVNAPNKRGETPLDSATVDEGLTIYFASLLKLPLDKEGLGQRKSEIADSLRQHGATAGQKAGLADLLMQIPVFNHLWFLWFLWWLVLGLALVSALGAWLPSIPTPAWLVASPARYFWLIPLTMIPQAFMGNAGASPFFGPDTSTGLLPIPHVLGYYAIFFAFGAIDYRLDDHSERVGKHAWLTLAIALLVVFPLGMAASVGWPAPLNGRLDETARRVLSLSLQSAYPWLMTFALMGLFRRYGSTPSPTTRYLSDSAYWLYLAHLPLIIAAQYEIRDWPVPAFVKFTLIVVVITAFLLWTYRAFVRYGWLGRFLNGPRVRPDQARADTVAA